MTAGERAGHWLEHLDELSPLGGERRLIHWRSAAAVDPAWQCPNSVRQWLEGGAMAERSRLRMMLASPAIFAAGWQPGWLQFEHSNGRKVLVGDIPETDVRVRLVSACVDRWRPISGWGYEPVRDSGSDGREKLKFGPKPVRRLVPAGGVYFFEVERGDVAQLTERWLKSVCDDEQDRRDGFGLAVWGTWTEHDR